MSYQAVLGFYEKLIIDALAPLQVFVNNQAIRGFDERSEYGFVRVNFGLTTEQNVGCEDIEFLRGSLVCEVYSRKDEGPGRGRELILPAIRALTRLNGVRGVPGQPLLARAGQITGPSQFAPEGRPHHLTRFSCPIHARYDGP